jgi:hypothetical protein
VNSACRMLRFEWRARTRAVWCLAIVASTSLHISCAAAPQRCSYPAKGGAQCLPIETPRSGAKAAPAFDASADAQER